MKKKYKLVLINPFNSCTRGAFDFQITMPPPLGLAVIAALTPDNWEVEIIDENFDVFEYMEADLVGITALTSAVYRGYEISEIYRKKGIKTIMGGIHVSMMPVEALSYCDTIVIGEAESVWQNVLDDFENKRLKKKYEGVRLEMHHSPIPRHDLLDSRYEYASVMTTRGCPMNCEFCSVHAFNGRKYRPREINEVLDELETVPQDKINFIDDDMIGYTEKSVNRAIELFKGMVERNINKDWVCQASLNFGSNDEMLHWAAKSGCRLVLIGIEAENPEQLQESNKKFNLKVGVDHFNEVFDRIHKHGIAVLGTLIYGFDSDDAEAMRKRTEFLINCKLDAYQTTILTPMPGTLLFDRLMKEKRIIKTDYPKDWQHYHGMEVTINPAKMSPEELFSEMKKNWEKMYDMKILYKKFLNSLKWTSDKKSASWAFTAATERHNVVFANSDRPQYDISSLLSGFKHI